jgi:uncharacterized protein
MSEDDLINFKKKLEDSMTFPGVYMFKFIVQSDNRNIALVENLFGPEADIHTKESGQGRYTSVTAKQVVMTSDEVIKIYQKALTIKGIMIL